MLKYTKPFLESLEALIGEAGYVLRYEKGNFKSGYCVLKEHKVVVINKYYTLEGKVNSLADIIRTLGLHADSLSEKSRKRFHEIVQAP